MIVDMAGSANRSQRPPLARHLLVVLDLHVGLKSQILMSVILGNATHQRGARCLSKHCRPGGMVRVSMSASNHAQTIAHAIKDRLDMGLHGRTRVNHNKVRFPHDVSVRAGTCHGPRIGGHNSAHALGERLHNSMGLHVSPPAGRC